MTTTNPCTPPSGIQHVDSPEAVSFRERWKPLPGKDYSYLWGYVAIPGNDSCRFIVALRREYEIPGADGQSDFDDLAMLEVDGKTLDSYKLLVREIRCRYGAGFFDCDVVRKGSTKGWQDHLEGRGFESWEQFVSHPSIEYFLKKSLSAEAK